MPQVIQGDRWVLKRGCAGYPMAFEDVREPPACIYGIGNPWSLEPGLAVIGARRATPYGRTCAERFARIAAEKGIPIISGGARGCDSAAHKAALAAKGPTVAILGGGCDEIYPPEHKGLFQQIVDSGGAVISEHPWGFPPKRFTFRERNRLIAGLSRAVLIVEAGLPSGTFSTADEALATNRDVLVVPGSITSKSSRGSNRLLYQGATPVVDEETFEDQLFNLFGTLKVPMTGSEKEGEEVDELIEAILATPMSQEEIYNLAVELYGAARAREEMSRRMAMAEVSGIITRYKDGLWGPCLIA